MNETISRIRKWTIFLVAALALGSLALSFNALQDLASSNGFDSWRSWVWPLLLDLGLIVFSFVVVYDSLQGEPTKGTWVLVGLFTIGTIGFNLSHAGDKALLTKVMAVVPPLTLFLTFERLMTILRSSVRRDGVIQSLADLTERVKVVTTDLSQLDSQKADLSKDVDALADMVNDLNVTANEMEMTIFDRRATLASLESDIKAAETRRQKALESVKALTSGDDIIDAESVTDITERRAIVLTMVNGGNDIDTIAAALEVSPRTVRRDIKALNGHVTK